MPPSACLRPRLLFLIDPLAQFLAGFEMRNEFLGYVDPLARLRIAADARRPMIQPETPEPADLDALPLDQALRHRIQDHLDREFGILGDELRIARREPRNKFGLGHAGPRLLLSVLVVQFRLEERAEVVEGIAFELLDPERDPLALDVDREHLGLGLLALLEIAHRLLAGQRPGEVGKVHEAVDSALEPDENAEVGDRLDRAADLVPFLEVRSELFPGIGKALLHPEGDAPPLLVDLEDHDLHLVAERDHFRRMLDTPPSEIGDMQQAVDAAQIDERAVVGDVLDDALDDRALLEVREQRLALRAL